MELIRRISRYWHTVRYLKPVQIYGRLWHQLTSPKVDLREPPEIAAVSGLWVAPVAKPITLIGPAQFDFLDVRGSIVEFGWNGLGREKLWRYNQHYFDDLNAVDAASRKDWHLALLSDWCLRNQPGVGIGWEAYPTSLRVVNWIKWALAGNGLSHDLLHSLAVQVRWLAKRLERHLLGNHLLANAKALVFAGLYFRGREADAWLRTGLEIFAAELPEQVLPDGGNFERSPMYHAIILEDVLDLLNAAEAWPNRVDVEIIDQWKAVSLSMRHWLEVMTHPDGELSFFNDAAIGVAPSPCALEEYAERLGHSGCSDKRLGNTYGEASLVAVTRLPESGYVRLAATDAVALLDVAPVGPDYLPAHAHADTLSFELSLHGKRAIVNGGTSCYGSSTRRQFERQTAAHSTVEVDGQSSSEVWGGFRVARRARPFDFHVYANADVASVVCSHDGYSRLPGRPIHRRQWQLRSRMFIVDDTVSGPSRSAVARYILHPDLRVNAVSKKLVELGWEDGQVFKAEVVAGTMAVVPATYSPRFGVIRDSQCLQVTLVDGRGLVVFRW